MQEHSIYAQIAERTGGSVYIGVVGPVRTGKSTFIKRFMEQLVIPNMENVYQRQRAQDELPQSGSGKTIMTSEPKFIPDEPVQISPDGKTQLSVRLIDCVGYIVPGAAGAEEDGQPRMVTTPWFDREIPLSEAAELGTRRVMEEHSSVGLVITTDGTVTELPREEYLDAERRAIEDMRATGKPYLVLVNSSAPQSAPAQEICKKIQADYGACALALDCQSMDCARISELFTALMYTFPVQEIRVFLPGWVRALPDEHPLKGLLYDAMREKAAQVTRLSEAQSVLRTLEELEQVDSFQVLGTELGSGVVTCELKLPERMFYEMLSAESGLEIDSDAALMQCLRELAASKQAYDKVKSALEQVSATGYGVVMPDAQSLHLETPELIRKNGSYAVRLRASAPSIHMLRADIETELSPMVGGEQESRQLIDFLQGEYETDTQKLWQSNIFGKSLYELVSEGLSSKLARLPDDTQQKFSRTLTKIINENTGGMICILL